MAIDGWTEAEPPWFELGERLGALQAPLVGAQEDEVVVMNSTTVNLHALLLTFFGDREEGKILADELNFPSDIYALKSHAPSPDQLVLVRSSDGKTLDERDIAESITEDVDIVILSSVLYQSGQLLDMEYLTSKAHDNGALIGFDLSHSAGVVPHKLSDWEVDFAFWCTYKYLNGGPGSVASLYVNRRHHTLEPGMAGWWGSDKERQFEMSLDFTPAETAGRWQVGTPHVLSMASLLGSLRVFQHTNIEKLREKSLRLTTYLMYLFEREVSDGEHRLHIITPRCPSKRGGHVAVENNEAWRICQAMKKRGIVADFRAPNTLRFAPSPLYTSFEQVWQVAEALKSIIDNKEYRQFSKQKDSVT